MLNFCCISRRSRRSSLPSPVKEAGLQFVRKKLLPVASNIPDQDVRHHCLRPPSVEAFLVCRGLPTAASTALLYTDGAALRKAVCLRHLIDLAQSFLGHTRDATRFRRHEAAAAYPNRIDWCSFRDVRWHSDDGCHLEIAAEGVS